MIVGDLVKSLDFEGIAKIVNIPVSDKGKIEVGFFESPQRPEENLLQVSSKRIKLAKLYDEAVVYCRDPITNIWCRARYAGERPGDRKHLVIFRQGEGAELSIEDIYCLNLRPYLIIGIIRDENGQSCQDCRHFPWECTTRFSLQTSSTTFWSIFARS